ncbi:XTP/dITP diphosphatase [Halalkalibacterium halodurans]|jgi:XTP/dITP diphosphohydrolase|uniref:dITP/XTP pyrophosphatase n=2 Tax=Halalkalibacterium halodurans TaxID=86665 RepID=IXTPA_HALH5|nr:XTP/dITP diphosphatase [Halalkalibacterium halodurans]Q9K8D9.1 RecName: Full=dITP/XTP pyrophosphatase; AltName: Full=Non-canonical purine NTP pyrophosphatase; AltName: Full=Non-standard purine NTP pyrophosphatase; AltName: Full=Nucleoside-triphosphate diphosphatase; AltName: Full=Nucleoside-triphosphate pyrophosphatase; Short=NTPase [Halalkalibacterium halodurans C-125]MDY7223613.1 XTP/dITP diphosphatase [Halalkalibacterium halodurans]MDY7242834.1 XTP/dITP diphosphatase [Halalkalibacterium ha
MKEWIVATKNKGKVAEFEAILGKRGFSVKSLLDYPAIEDIEETGSTFNENATIKAEAIAERFQRPVLADDSGLIIDALDGRPGIFSARYAGEEKDDQKNIEKVLRELQDIPWKARTARFHCSIALARPQAETIVFEGTCEGYITTEPKGTGGFGYDPIFYVPSHDKTMAELTQEEKNKLSHRYHALKQLDKWLD